LTIYHALLAFTAAAGLLTMAPGLDTALVLRTAAVEGPRRSMLAGAGVCCGLLIWGLAASAGLGALLAASRMAYTALRIVGACYLIFLGTKILLRKYNGGLIVDDSSSQQGSERTSSTRWFLRGLLTNLLNPKVGVFYVTFLPQFIPTGVSVTLFSMLLAAIHATEGMLWFALLNAATRPLSRWLQRRRVSQALDRVTGTVLAGFGIGLLIENRR
jgi:threonine/homoserine/homoserine lactone efflux protein